MLDILVVLAAVFLGYAFLRSYGGKGLDIEVKFAPASTPEGKRDRIMALGVCLIIFGAIGFVAVRQTTASPLAYFGTYLLIGVTIVGLSILKARKK